MPQNVLDCLAQFCLAPLKISLPPGQLALEQELASVRRVCEINGGRERARARGVVLYYACL
jgi:hypothetical protein